MVEQVELTEPWKAVEGEGWEPELVSIRPGKIQAAKHHDKADSVAVEPDAREAASESTTLW